MPGDSVWVSTALFLGANAAWYYFHHDDPDAQNQQQQPPRSSSSNYKNRSFGNSCSRNSNEQTSWPRQPAATENDHDDDDDHYFQRRLEHRLSFPRYVDAATSTQKNYHSSDTNAHPIYPPPRTHSTSLTTDDDDNDNDETETDALQDTTRSALTINSSKYSVDFYPKHTNWQHFECFENSEVENAVQNTQDNSVPPTTTTTPLKNLFVREISSSEQRPKDHEHDSHTAPYQQHDSTNNPLDSAVEDTVQPGSMTLTRETKQGQGAIYISLEGERTAHSQHGTTTASHHDQRNEQDASSAPLFWTKQPDVQDGDDDGVSSMDDEDYMVGQDHASSSRHSLTLPVILSERQIHNNPTHQQHNPNNHSPRGDYDLLNSSSRPNSAHESSYLLDESENDGGDDQTDPGRTAFQSAARASKRYSSRQAQDSSPTKPRAKLNHRHSLSTSIPHVLSRSLQSLLGGSSSQAEDAAPMPPTETNGSSPRLPPPPSNSKRRMPPRSTSAPLTMTPRNVSNGRRPSSSASARVVRANYNARIMPAKVILLRHGQSMGNLDETLYSKLADNAIPLTELGWKQARAAGEQLKREVEGSSDVHFIVSPYVRTVETFHGIAAAWCDPEGPEFQQITDPLLRRKAWYARLVDMGLSWAEDPRIREQDFGNLQDPAKIKQSKKERNHFGAFYYRFAHGESAADVFDRISTFLDSLWRSFDVHPSRHFVLVTHGIAIRVLLARYFRYTIDQFHMLSNPRNCEMICLSHDGRGRLEMSGRHELEMIPRDHENQQDDSPSNENNATTHDDFILRYKFQKRLRVLPPSFVRKVNIRISYSETNETEKDEHYGDHE